MGAYYLVQSDPYELVYAIDLGMWFLIGEYRSFSLEEDGTVCDLSSDERSSALTLDDFEPHGEFCPRCQHCSQFDDWTHKDNCPVDPDW